MINHIWSVICKKSIVDSQTNIISLLEIIEVLDVNVVLPPNLDPKSNINIPIEFEFVTMWQRDFVNKEENFDTQIVVTDPKGTQLNAINGKMNMPINMMRLRSITRISGLGLTDSGNYTLFLKMKQQNDKNYKAVTAIPLEVKLTKNIQNNTN